MSQTESAVNSTLRGSIISQAASTFFVQVMSDIFKTEFGGIAGDAVEDLLNLLLGEETAPDLANVLNQISSQLTSIQASINALPVAVEYQSSCTTFESESVGIGKQLSSLQNAASGELIESDITAVMNFITPGSGATTFTDYSSCIDNLLSIAYGVTMAEFVDSDRTYPMGIGTCEAVSMNSNMLAANTEVAAYVLTHSKFAVTVTTLITGMANQANQVFEYLNNPANQAAIFAQYPQFESTLPPVLANKQMLADISDTTANSFIPALLGPSLANAPSYLCGGVFPLVTTVSYNLANPANTIPYYFTISNGGQYLTIGGNTIDNYYAVAVSKSSGSQWQLEPVSTQPFSLSSTLVYTGSKQCMIIANSGNYAIDADPEIQVVAGLPAYTSTIQWEMLTCANAAGQVAVIFQSLAAESTGFAGGALTLDGANGYYDTYNPNNPNQQWLIFFTTE